MNIIIFGPPGAGKGTQSKFIVNKFNLYQLSTGDLLRKEIKNKTKLGSEISSIINSGELVSDEIVSNLIEKFVSNDTYKNKIIFDGYPRTLIQAKNLDNLLKKYKQKNTVKKTEPIDFEQAIELLNVFINKNVFKNKNLKVNKVEKKNTKKHIVFTSYSCEKCISNVNFEIENKLLIQKCKCKSPPKHILTNKILQSL